MNLPTTAIFILIMLIAYFNVDANVPAETIKFEDDLKVCYCSCFAKPNNPNPTLSAL